MAAPRTASTIRRATPAFRAPADEKPPLLVFAHGGPTSNVTRELKPTFQYWTSRGFAVVDVNYGGSTGFGRDYRKRLIITGGSAGGYTTLAAIAFRDVFAAGADLFGVSDLHALERDTHKLEKHYLSSLIGSGSAAEKLYQERTPLLHADKIKRPLIIFQGLQDVVVPANYQRTIENELYFFGKVFGFKPAGDPAQVEIENLPMRQKSIRKFHRR